MTKETLSQIMDDGPRLILMQALDICLISVLISLPEECGEVNPLIHCMANFILLVVRYKCHEHDLESRSFITFFYQWMFLH